MGASDDNLRTVDNGTAFLKFMPKEHVRYFSQNEQILPLGRNGTQQVRAALFNLLESGSSSFQTKTKGHH